MKLMFKQMNYLNLKSESESPKTRVLRHFAFTTILPRNCSGGSSFIIHLSVDNKYLPHTHRRNRKPTICVPNKPGCSRYLNLLREMHKPFYQNLVRFQGQAKRPCCQLFCGGSAGGGRGVRVTPAKWSHSRACAVQPAPSAPQPKSIVRIIGYQWRQKARQCVMLNLSHSLKRGTMARIIIVGCGNSGTLVTK